MERNDTQVHIRVPEKLYADFRAKVGESTPKYPQGRSVSNALRDLMYQIAYPTRSTGTGVKPNRALSEVQGAEYVTRMDELTPEDIAEVAGHLAERGGY